MATKKQIKRDSPRKSKSVPIGRKSVRIPVSQRTKQELEHELKLGLMKHCVIFGKSHEAAALFFEARGHPIGSTQQKDLRRELKSSKMMKEWFSKEALYVIEDDHYLSVERIRIMENRLLEEFEQVANTNFYTYIKKGKNEQVLIRNKAHDANLLLRIISSFEKLQETKTKMFSATPMVQEMMEVHRMQEEESTMQAKPAETEKPIET